MEKKNWFLTKGNRYQTNLFITNGYQYFMVPYVMQHFANDNDYFARITDVLQMMVDKHVIYQ